MLGILYLPPTTVEICIISHDHSLVTSRVQQTLYDSILYSHLAHGIQVNLVKMKVY